MGEFALIFLKNRDFFGKNPIFKNIFSLGIAFPLYL
jgi:hypothetical protein